MSLSRDTRESIKKAIINKIGESQYLNNFSIVEISEEFGLSKNSVYRLIRELCNQSLVISQKSGRTNKYKLAEKSHEFSFKISGLSEDTVWNCNIKPLISSVDKTAYGNLNYAFTEMLNNAIEHSEGENIRIGLIINPYAVRIYIKDDGVGIFEKIRKALNLEEKRFAVLELAKGKFTTEPQSHSGEGIFFSSKAVDEFAILSDDISFLGKVMFGSDSNYMFEDKSLFCKGTTVLMMIKSEHETPISEIFYQYTQMPDDFGFNKTVVPVNLLEYGEENPTFISRSQAKRLLTRFEKFESIQLDFQGIDSIGQGFADEIFRIFIRQHPDCKITPINCNENVMSMIKHVQNVN